MYDVTLRVKLFFKKHSRNSHFLLRANSFSRQKHSLPVQSKVPMFSDWVSNHPNARTTHKRTRFQYIAGVTNPPQSQLAQAASKKTLTINFPW